MRIAGTLSPASRRPPGQPLPIGEHRRPHRDPRRRGRDHDAARELSAGSRLSRFADAQRHPVARPDGRRSAAARAARPRPARRGWLLDCPAVARALAMRPGDRHRPRRLDRQGGRPRGRRRRLRHQAVRPARAARSHQGGAPAHDERRRQRPRERAARRLSLRHLATRRPLAPAHR